MRTGSIDLLLWTFASLYVALAVALLAISHWGGVW